MMRLAGKCVGLFLVALCAVHRMAAAQDSTGRGVRIGLTYDPATRPGTLVLPVAGARGDSVRALLLRDLDFGDRLAPIEGEAGAGGAVNYPLARTLGASIVVQATVTAGGLHVAIHDVAGAAVTSVFDAVLSQPVLGSAWRHGVHRVADEVERLVTGSRGIAATRVLFVRGGQVWSIDSDGAGEGVLTTGGTALSPAWHPNGRSFAYSVLGPRGSQILLRDVAGSPRVIATGGLNITPTFAPDGSALAYAHGVEAGTDVMLAPLGGGASQRVTVGRGTDNLSPSFSPDGRRLVFASGRSGHPEVYISDADGTNAELLTTFTFGEAAYRSNPDWSPDGRLVAYQARVDGRFQVMTIALRDRSVRQVTSEGVSEDPSWAPDGRHLVVTSSRGGGRHLYVVDSESGRTRQLTRGAPARLAAWSRSLDPIK